jgi:hypothetical protein
MPGKWLEKAEALVSDTVLKKPGAIILSATNGSCLLLFMCSPPLPVCCGLWPKILFLFTTDSADVRANVPGKKKNSLPQMESVGGVW